MPARSIFWRFVRDETVRTVMGPDFIGFLGIMVLVFPFSFYNIGQSQNPLKDQTYFISSLVGLMCSLFFAYLVSKNFTKEFEKRTINILVTTPLGRSKVFIGKALSLALLIPITLGVISLALASVYSTSGKIPMIQVEYALYFFLLLALFLLSVIAFSMLISLWLKKTGSMMTVMALYIFIFLFLGSVVGITPEPYGRFVVDYPLNLLFPASLYIVALFMFNNFLVPDWLLVASQIGFIITCFLMGLVLFRRSQIWG